MIYVGLIAITVACLIAIAVIKFPDSNDDTYCDCEESSFLSYKTVYHGTRCSECSGLIS